MLSDTTWRRSSLKQINNVFIFLHPLERLLNDYLNTSFQNTLPDVSFVLRKKLLPTFCSTTVQYIEVQECLQNVVNIFNTIY